MQPDTLSLLVYIAASLAIGWLARHKGIGVGSKPAPAGGPAPSPTPAPVPPGAAAPVTPPALPLPATASAWLGDHPMAAQLLRLLLTQLGAGADAALHNTVAAATGAPAVPHYITPATPDPTPPAAPAPPVPTK